MYKQKGFTIVELLIVVVIIGILAAIVVVAYNGITSQANDSAVESDLATIAKKLEIYKVENGSYPAHNTTELEAADMKATKSVYMDRNNLYYCRSTDGQHYSIGAYSINDSRYYLIDGTVNSTTDNVYGEANCNNLPGTAPGDHPQYSWTGYNQSGGTGWASWLE